MLQIVRQITFIALAFLVFGCSSGPINPDITDRPLAMPDTTAIVQSGDLRIGPTDRLTINVFNVDALSGTYQVDHRGLLKLPLIGEVNAKGYTSLELADVLEDRFGETYLQNPDVSVSIDESVGERVTVEGSVKSPGVFPVQGQMSLLQAVALAGGPSDGANPKRVIIFRQIEGARHAAGYDLTQIRAGNAADPAIFGNDIIVMDGSEARRTYTDIVRSVPILALFLAL